MVMKESPSKPPRSPSKPLPSPITTTIEEEPQSQVKPPRRKTSPLIPVMQQAVSAKDSPRRQSVSHLHKLMSPASNEHSRVAVPPDLIPLIMILTRLHSINEVDIQKLLDKPISLQPSKLFEHGLHEALAEAVPQVSKTLFVWLCQF